MSPEHLSATLRESTAIQYSAEGEHEMPPTGLSLEERNELLDTFLQKVSEERIQGELTQPHYR